MLPLEANFLLPTINPQYHTQYHTPTSYGTNTKCTTSRDTIITNKHHIIKSIEQSVHKYIEKPEDANE